jgi:TetR/AcrR family transcriptional regulator, transcriptional repressor for nem operon
MAGGDTREQILKLASDLLQERGYNAFSFGHIAEKLDVKPAAIHYHFPTKTDLGVALVDRYRARYRKWMDDADAQGLPAWAKLEGYIHIMARHAEGTRSCPAGALQAEFAAIPDELQDAVKKMVKEIHRWLVRVLEEGRADKSFKFAGTPDDKAIVLMATLQGALQAARALGKDRFHAAVRQLRLELAC